MAEKNISLIGGDKKERQSNIEALRLLSMLMVLNLHSFHGYEYGKGFLQFLDFFRESTSICAVNIFILISGYFGIKCRIKSCYNLLFQCAFYSFAIYFVTIALKVNSFNLMSFAKCFGCYISSWGFITNYIVLYFLSPIINKYVDNATKKELLSFILLLFLIENTICITINILNFILLYLIGRFLHKADAIQSSNKNTWKGYLIMTLIITLITYFTFKFTPIKTAALMCTFPLGFSYTSPFIIIPSILLFIFFAKIKFTSKIINWSAASCLSIFLIHMHPAVKASYYGFTESLYNYNFVTHATLLIFLIISIFIGCILIDKIRIIISDLTYALLCKIKHLLPERLFRLDTYLPLVVKK